MSFQSTSLWRSRFCSTFKHYPELIYLKTYISLKQGKKNSCIWFFWYTWVHTDVHDDDWAVLAHWKYCFPLFNFTAVCRVWFFYFLYVRVILFFWSFLRSFGLSGHAKLTVLEFLKHWIALEKINLYSLWVLMNDTRWLCKWPLFSLLPFLFLEQLERGIHGLEPVVVASFPTKKFGDQLISSGRETQ